MASDRIGLDSEPFHGSVAYVVFVMCQDKGDSKDAHGAYLSLLWMQPGSDVQDWKSGTSKTDDWKARMYNISGYLGAAIP